MLFSRLSTMYTLSNRPPCSSKRFAYRQIHRQTNRWLTGKFDDYRPLTLYRERRGLINEEYLNACALFIEQHVAISSLYCVLVTCRRKQQICTALNHERFICKALRRGTWNYNLPPTRLSTSGMSRIGAFTSQPQSITALWPVLISRPAKGRRLSWPGVCG